MVEQQCQQDKSAYLAPWAAAQQEYTEKLKLVDPEEEAALKKAKKLNEETADKDQEVLDVVTTLKGHVADDGSGKLNTVVPATTLLETVADATANLPSFLQLQVQMLTEVALRFHQVVGVRWHSRLLALPLSSTPSHALSSEKF